MKSKVAILSIASVCAMNSVSNAQVTHLDSPEGGPKNRVVVEPNGNIQIPQNLFLNGNIYAGYLLLNPQSESQGGGFRMLGAPGSPTWFVDAASDRLRIFNDLNSAEPLTINNSGNVGIGTAAPADKCEIFGGDLRLRTSKFGSDGNGGIRFTDENGNPATRIFPELNNSLRISTTGNPNALGVLSSGYVGIGTASPQSALDINGTTRSQHLELTAAPESGTYINSTERLHIQTRNGNALHLNPFGGLVAVNAVSGGELQVNGKIRCTTLELTSDRNQKQDFIPASGQAILRKIVDLPISTWAYTNSPSELHIGAMAQDFKSAFALGGDDKHINAGDGIGVAFAAIQGLHELVQEKDSEIAALKRQVAAMKQELSSVKDTITERLIALEESMHKGNVQRVSFHRGAAR